MGKKSPACMVLGTTLENLQPGKNAIAVSLNANTHETLAHNGKMIQDTENVDVPARSN